jgi:2-oxoglutarate ferredoxin oxidoreductase subunit gamma
MLHEMICAGFGGQGILTMGMIMAYGAVDQGLETSWYPSYGPESRGGTSNCTVMVSDQRIASPSTNSPSGIIAMNEPSFTKFVPRLRKGGVVVCNRDLITSAPPRDDVEYVWVDANTVAKELGNLMTASNICLGAFNAKLGFLSREGIEQGMSHVFTGSKSKLIPMNMDAYDRGAKLALNGKG